METFKVEHVEEVFRLSRELANYIETHFSPEQMATAKGTGEVYFGPINPICSTLMGSRHLEAQEGILKVQLWE